MYPFFPSFMHATFPLALIGLMHAWQCVLNCVLYILFIAFKDLKLDLTRQTIYGYFSVLLIKGSSCINCFLQSF